MPTSTLEKVQSFSKLKDNWSFGEGSEFNVQILNKALQLVKTAHALGFQETDTFPGLNGEIMVTLYLGQDYWEFTLESDGSVIFVYEKGEETCVYEEGLPFEFAISMVTSIALQNNLPIFGAKTMTKVVA